MYKVRFHHSAEEQLRRMAKSDPKSLKKVQEFVSQLLDNPRVGTGKPERLKGYEVETWSRRINKKDRLVYEIHDMEVLVLVVSVQGHYEE